MIWAGSDDGRLHVTTDGGATWTSVEGNVPGVPKNTWIPHVEPSHFDAAEAFVVFDDHRRFNWEPYVYRTRDHGVTWTRLVDGDDVSGYALVIAQDPVDRDLLFVGTEFGLWFSLDGGGKWMKWTHGVPTTSVMDLVVHPRDHDLVVATHGRSLYVVDDVSPLRELGGGLDALHLFPTSPARQYEPEPIVGGNATGHGDFAGENRPYGALLTFWLDVEGVPRPGDGGGRDDAPKAEVVVEDASGKTVRTFKTPVHQGMNRAVWDLRRDAYKRPPREEPSFFGRRGGPEVAPGTYTLTVKFKDHEAEGTVEVVADPHSEMTPDDWQAREAALARVEKLSADLTDAVLRMADVRTDLDAVERLARRAKKDGDEDGEEEEAEAEDDPYQPIHDAIKEVRESFDGLEKRLRVVPGTKGIVRRMQVDTDVGYATRAITAIWEAPTPTDLAYLDKAEKALAAVLGELDQVFADQVVPLKAKVEEAGLTLLAEPSPRT